MSKLLGEVALISGGGGLLGKEHALALCSEGATVVLTDINEFGLKQAQDWLLERGHKVLAIKADLTNQNSLALLDDQIKEHELAVSVLVNNAAINHSITLDTLKEDTSVENFSLERWNAEIQVNLTSAFLCSKIFGSQMAKRGRGCIVNIASDLSVIAPDNRLYSAEDSHIDKSKAKSISYSVSKTALVALTKYLAVYWAEDGVRVNALSPGGIYVNQPDKFVEKIQKLIPMKRMASPDEYRGALVFLCSKDSSYMTGHNLVIDGGRSVI